VIDEPEKDSHTIVPSVGCGLTRPASGLIQRGLLELSRLGPDRGLARSSEKARVLVCDSIQEGLVEVITTMLEAAGYEVRSTLNPLEAIEVAKAFQPHLALLGLLMSTMNGIELALEFTKFLSRTKIIITSCTRPSPVELFRERGWPFDILDCPFEKEEFLEKAGAWVREAYFYDLATGLYNADHFGFILDTEILRSERYGYAFSIIFCKIQPSSNLQGDDESIWRKNRLLRKVADQVKSVCRLIDFAFYLLDNEFALLLPQTTQAAAARVTDLLRRRLQESDWKDESGIAVKLDAAVTFASFPEDGRTKPVLLARLFK